MRFERASLPKALWCFVFARDTYLEMAVDHGMAVNLEAADLRKAYDAGTFPKPDWRDEALKNERIRADDLQQKILTSLLAILLASALVIGIGFWKDTISFHHRIDTSKVLAFIGTQLAAWATLLELGGALATWKGQGLHELIHPLIFKVLFIPGVALALAGAVL